MAKILDGKKLNAEIALHLKEIISSKEIRPKLVIVQVGDLAESNSYIKRKIAFADSIGALVEHKKYPESVTEEMLIADIKKYNADSLIHGIIVQLPIPNHLNPYNIIETIDPKKDVDGLTAANTKPLFDNTETFIPATARGIVTLLQHYKVDIDGTKVTLIGESSLVGRPIALTLLNRGATITICHTHTRNLENETKQADIIIVAAGHPGLITTKHVSPKQVILDVGISIIGKKVVGDVDYQNVEKIVEAISPVPGGIGPMTIVSLFQNLLEAQSLQT